MGVEGPANSSERAKGLDAINRIKRGLDGIQPFSENETHRVHADITLPEPEELTDEARASLRDALARSGTQYMRSTHSRAKKIAKWAKNEGYGNDMRAGNNQ